MPAENNVPKTQNAEVSLREARQLYESLAANAKNKRARIDALYRWNEAAKDYFSKRADAFLTKQPPTENSWNETYAEHVLRELADHHDAVREAATQLGLESKTLIPPFIKFKTLQSFIRDKEPDVAQDLRNRYIEVGLPIYGFDKKRHLDLEWRWFIAGCVLILLAFGLAIWGFSLGTLTGDQRRLLVWALPLASGFAAGAFAGSFVAQARDWIPGLLITGTGGFGVWLLTFFFLFPITKEREQSIPKSTPTANVDGASGTGSREDTGTKDASNRKAFYTREALYRKLGYLRLTIGGDVEFQGGVEPGSIWRFASSADRVCERPAFLTFTERTISRPSAPKIVFTRQDLSSEMAANVLGDHFADALRVAGAESVEVDLGFTVTQDVSEDDFAEIKQWPTFYSEQYEMARKGEDGLVVISSVLVSKGDQFRVRGSTISRLKDIAEMLHEERSATYELKQEADGSILIAASQTRSVAVGYRPLIPSHMPSLAFASPTATPGITPAKKEYVLAWYDHFENRLFKVEHPNMSNVELTGGNPNEVFRSWCSPLDLSHKKIIKQIEVAGDEQFKGGEPNWWTKDPYNLPALNPRWPQILDDERWYMLELEDEVS